MFAGLWGWRVWYLVWKSQELGSAEGLGVVAYEIDVLQDLVPWFQRWETAAVGVAQPGRFE
jgi:hypothetical protein